jgi:hypothetical protein
MTTQTNVDRSNEAIQSPTQINHLILRFVILALLITAVITAAYLVISPGERIIATNDRVIEAQAARFQGLADLFAEKEIALERSWSVSATRYQGLADAYAANNAALERGWDASAARYQGLAENFEANSK